MGVADNKSYKNMYHFSDRYYNSDPANLPSIKGEPTINSSIKENPYRSNVEIEKDELVVKPDLTAIFKAHGKKHYDGGIQVDLPADSFIISDDKSLAFTPHEHEQFEFKQGGSTAKRLNTPADVLKRNIDIKHYNTISNVLKDPHKDDLAKKSSARMLEKYIGVLGNVAFLQEQKKGFPSGVPPFSEGTAPVYNDQTKDMIMEQKQYAKYGGTMNPKAQLGYTPQYNANQYKQNFYFSNNPYASTYRGDKYATANPKTGIVSNNWNAAGSDYPTLKAYGDAVGYPDDLPYEPSSIQQWVMQQYPDLVAKHHAPPPPGFGEPNAGRPDDGILGVRWKAIADEVSRLKPGMPNRLAPTPLNPSRTNIVGTPDVPTAAGPDMPSIAGNPQGAKTANWKFTPWQRLSQGYNLAKYASVDRQMPMRSQVQASYVDPYLVNPEQAIGDIRAQGYQQTQALNSLNPILRNAQSQAIAGSVMDRLPQVRSQYDNQNASVMNQARQYNNQVRNNNTAQNVNMDQDYYRATLEGQKNFKNMKTYTADQYMNNLLGDASTNQSLAYNLLTQRQPAYNYDWNTGNFSRTNKSILDASQPKREGILESYMNNIDFKNLDRDQQLRFLSILTKNKALQNFEQYKKGGKVKRNPYK